MKIIERFETSRNGNRREGIILHHRYAALIFPFVGGLLLAASFPMKFLPAFPLGGILGVALWLHFTRWMRPDLSWRWTFFSFLCFSGGFNLLGFYWIPETLSEFGQIPFPLNYLIGTAFSLIVVPHFLLALAAHYVWQKWIPCQRWPLPGHYHHLLLAGLLWGLEALVPQQFPAHLGHSWLHLAPHLGMAPICGASGMSLISFYLAVALADRKSYLRPLSSFLLPITSFLLMISLNYLLPLAGDHHSASSRQISLRMVQANIGNYDKVSSRQGSQWSLQKTYQRFYSLSTSPVTVADHPLDLIIWPETAYPHLLFSPTLKAQAAPIPELIATIAAKTQADLLIGGYDLALSQGDANFENQYNSAFHFSGQGQLLGVYHKIKLIPFGEGLPFGPFNRFLSGHLTNISFFAAGTTFTLFHHSRKDVTFITAICYEILFPSSLRYYLQKLPRQPDFIINLTNDSWYGDTSEPYQHLFLSKWRALEFQLPIARMTNTGITSLIYPDGSESRRLPLFTADFLDVTLNLPPLGAPSPTIYQRWGNWVNGSIFLLLFLLLTVLANTNIFFQNRFSIGQHNGGK